MNDNQIVTLICNRLDKLYPKSEGSYSELITHVEDRAGHDRRCAIDATKIERTKLESKRRIRKKVRKNTEMVFK